MIISYMLSQSLYVAARLGIADLLQNGPQSSDALATAVGAHPDALYRVLRALASVGIFAEVEHRQFTLTPLARCLQTDVPGSL
jgi:DNA-binding IclR family transcriptional regulator